MTVLVKSDQDLLQLEVPAGPKLCLHPLHQTDKVRAFLLEEILLRKSYVDVQELSEMAKYYTVNCTGTVTKNILLLSQNV